LSRIGELRDARPGLIFLSTKTFHLADILQELGQVYIPGTKIIATQNGLEVEDSMCNDIENNTPTEIDFLGAKVVEYARATGISTPFYVTLTNRVKAIGNNYLAK
jgi:ketopantoate reductase